MASRFVDDAERQELLRGHIAYAMEIVETFKVAFEDNLHPRFDPEAAVEMLDDALNRLQCAYQDSFDSVENSTIN